MTPMRIFVAGLCWIALSCAAAPFAVQVGEARIAVDAPQGFSDTAFTGSPRLQELAETLTSPSNRILLFAITDGDLRRFMAGDPPEFKRQALIATPRSSEQERTRAEAFAAFAADAMRDFGAAPAPGADYRRMLDGQPGKVLTLSELRRDGASVSVMQGMRLPSPPRPMFAEERPGQYVLSTTSFLLVRGKTLALQLVSSYEAPGDLDWLRAATLRWLEDLQKLNSR